MSLTTDVLSNLATLGLKQCLARQESVVVRVVSKNFLALLNGWVDGVEVHGRGWQSPRGVTCRAIAVRAGAIGVEVGAVLRGQIILRETVQATAQLDLNAQDFNNFLGSVLLKDTLARLVIDQELLTGLRVEGLQDQQMFLSGIWGAERRDFVLTAGATGKAVVTGGTPQLAQALQDFLNTLTVDLHGLELGLDCFSLNQDILRLKAKARIWQFPGALSF
ncbi:LmeA family phospholipid-binding protein [Candidatus Cyanaurora vandensis]|uniref:LmeA family phospholipid-binding protein n=1 Tax=Candidatus Cyanaurora vandensis TaxID=2714958 RepID=UPI0025795108|nr:LmeA family phospholipid-binding protein [Candidatus Cyanaurora vandensis]